MLFIDLLVMLPTKANIATVFLVGVLFTLINV